YFHVTGVQTCALPISALCRVHTTGFYGVDHRDSEGPAGVGQGGDVGEHAPQRIRALCVGAQEVALHVVDEEHRTGRGDLPLCPVGGQLVHGGQRIGGDGWQAHRVVSNLRASSRRSSLREIFPTPVTGKRSTNSTRSGIL